jgi:hypothetical protein
MGAPTAGDVLLHVSAEPRSDRAHLAVRLGLVALAEHRDVTILLSGAAVALAASTPDPQPAHGRSCDGHRSLAAMLARFVDNGGRLCVLHASAQEHDVSEATLLDGAVLVSPGWVVDEALAAGATLTFS